MPSYKYIIIAFVTLIFTRYILNIFRFRRTLTLYAKYQEYLRNGDVTFAQWAMEIKDLFKEAQLKDSSVTHQEFLGYGRFANMRVSVFDNIHNTREDIVNLMELSFNQAIGGFP